MFSDALLRRRTPEEVPMSSYNFARRADRDRCRADRQAEIDAVVEGRWPRNLDDEYRWLNAPVNPYLSAAHNAKIRADYARSMCEAEINYLNDVDARIAAGDESLAGWEG